MGRLLRQRDCFATTCGLVALGLVACGSGEPLGRPDTGTGATLGDAGTSGAGDWPDAGTAGEGGSSNAFPPPDMSGPLPDESSSGGESSTSDADTLGVLPGCDIYGQDCPAGEKCTIWASDGGELPDAVRCVPVGDAAGQPGDLCHVFDPGSGADDCAVGSYCQLGLEDLSDGVCVSFCSGDPDNAHCENPDQACGLFFEGVAPICFTACEEGGNVCPVGQICHPLSEAGVSACVDEDSLE